MARFSAAMLCGVSNKDRPMPQLNRRMFLAATAAGATLRALPQLAKPGGKRVLTLVYDKSLGMMRAIDRIVK